MGLFRSAARALSEATTTTVATTKPDPDPQPKTLMWGAMTREPRRRKTTARTRRGEPTGEIYDGVRRYW